MEGNTIYTVTENGESRNYLAVDGCSLESVGKLCTGWNNSAISRRKRLSGWNLNKRYDFSSQEQKCIAPSAV
jgi:hypothetical protein